MQEIEAQSNQSIKTRESTHVFQLENRINLSESTFMGGSPKMQNCHFETCLANTVDGNCELQTCPQGQAGPSEEEIYCMRYVSRQGGKVRHRP